MSQHIQHHLTQQYIHYNPPNHQQLPIAHVPQNDQQQLPITHVAPNDTQRHSLPQHQHQHQHQIHQVHHQQQQQQSTPQPSGSNGPLIAKGDWTKDLVQLAKMAELKKHALTLQLHTAHILSAHASLEAKGKAIQDLREQKNKLESERTRLLHALRQINEDRDKVDMMEASLEKECKDTRDKIDQLTDGDYAIAKADVDRLRQELGQPPLPNLQSTLEEKTAQYLTDRRLNGNESQTQAVPQPARQPAVPSSSSATATKRSAPASTSSENQVKRPRGRPKGSKNKNKASADGASWAPSDIVTHSEVATSCADVFVLFARGTSEPPTLGVLIRSPLKNDLGRRLAARRLTLEFLGVEYPAETFEFLTGGYGNGGRIMWLGEYFYVTSAHFSYGQNVTDAARFIDEHVYKKGYDGRRFCLYFEMKSFAVQVLSVVCLVSSVMAAPLSIQFGEANGISGRAVTQRKMEGDTVSVTKRHVISEFEDPAAREFSVITKDTTVIPLGPYMDLKIDDYKIETFPDDAIIAIPAGSQLEPVGGMTMGGGPPMMDCGDGMVAL
ncbi:hypothetical protein CVT24_011161 [Panaeolus cyanescens]|uniref:Uncharacterized protein n=1 Tax=Panaeolus cyanescens TaxID=181874 RepID=A0A409YGF2_9AGAR|nr:hypothetical protein CVT24_011161 [Panaeolus cyanescens]